MRHVINRLVLHSTVALVLALPIAWAAGCGGVTDIDFKGDDSGKAGSGGIATGGKGGTTSTGATGGAGIDGGAPGGGGIPPSGGVSGIGGGPDGGAPGGGGVGGVVCGGVECPPPQIPIGQVESCCSGDKCGLTSSFLGGQCAELGQEGSPDPNCPQQSIMGFNLEGCCKPNNKCGVLDTFLGLGCVDPEQFGGPPSPNCGVVVVDAGMGGTGGAPQDGGPVGEVNCGNTNPDICTSSENCCVLNPGLDYCSAKTTPCACTQTGCDITTVACDGAEDCPGQICCGTFSFQSQSYTDASCKNSCGGQNEREICHLGDACTNPGETCSSSNFLPAYLHRCN